MQKPRTLGEEISWILISSFCAGGGLLTTAATARLVGFGVPSEILWATPTAGISMALWSWYGYKLGQLPGRKPMAKKLSNTFASSQLRRTEANDPDLQSWLYRWKNTRREREFEFLGFGLQTPIPETTLGRFLKLAWRRQTNAVYGNKYTLMRNEDGSFKKLTVNQVLSKEYFTKRTRPTFLDEEYLGCIFVLSVGHLILGRRQGRGGQLRYPPEKTLELAKERWYDRPTEKGAIPTLFDFLRLAKVH